MWLESGICRAQAKEQEEEQQQEGSKDVFLRQHGQNFEIKCGLRRGHRIESEAKVLPSYRFHFIRIRNIA